MLRHTYANLILRSQTHTDLNTLRRLMRHASLATTQLYLGEDEDAERGAIIALDRKLAAL
jgi:integrase